PSQAEEQEIVVVDSQEQIVENGSHKQMVQLENGTQRELSEEERAEMLENEILEEMVAESLRQEEHQMWEDFHAAEFRSWESWAAVQDDFLHGRKKRARVQEGERLSYSVSVLQNDEGDEEDEPDPTAAASGDHGDPAIAVRGQGVADHAEQGAGVSNVDSTRTVEDVLPITGEKPAEMWDEINTSKPVVVANAESFVNTDNGKEAYSLWRQGKLTDRHIGNKYGYNVLGNFYGRRDWENGVFDDDLAAESAHGDARDPTPGASHGRPEEDVHGEL
ncbi:unnamed protein product, partial [Symbiodinium pilosum]